MTPHILTAARRSLHVTGLPSQETCAPDRDRTTLHPVVTAIGGRLASSAAPPHPVDPSRRTHGTASIATHRRSKPHRRAAGQRFRPNHS